MTSRNRLLAARTVSWVNSSFQKELPNSQVNSSFQKELPNSQVHSSFQKELPNSQVHSSFQKLTRIPLSKLLHNKVPKQLRYAPPPSSQPSHQHSQTFLWSQTPKMVNTWTSQIRHAIFKLDIYGSVHQDVVY